MEGGGERQRGRPLSLRVNLTRSLRQKKKVAFIVTPFGSPIETATSCYDLSPANSNSKLPFVGLVSVLSRAILCHPPFCFVLSY